jgi:hypothetical protein
LKEGGVGKEGGGRGKRLPDLPSYKITPELLARMPTPLHVAVLCQARYSGVLSPEDLEILSVEVLREISGDKAITALRERKVTLETILQAPNWRYVRFLFSSACLEKKLITPEEIYSMPNFSFLNYLLDENGVKCLEQGLITVQQARQYTSAYELGLYIDRLAAASKN